VCAGATIVFVPEFILTLGAGFIFAHIFGMGVGLLLASTSIFIGYSVGAVGAFVLGRYAMRRSVQRWFQKYKIMEHLDRALQSKKGIQIVLLFRLSSIVPFNSFNYVAAITKLQLRDYILALPGTIPGTVGYIFAGTTASGILNSIIDPSLSDATRIVSTLIFVLCAMCTIVTVAVLGRYANKKLATMLDDDLERSHTGSNTENVAPPPPVMYNKKREGKSSEQPPSMIRRNLNNLRITIPNKVVSPEAVRNDFYYAQEADRKQPKLVARSSVSGAGTYPPAEQRIISHFHQETALPRRYHDEFRRGVHADAKSGAVPAYFREVKTGP